MKTISKYLIIMLISPLTLAGIVMWALLLVNQETGGGTSISKALKIVFSLPKTAEKKG